jgi:hypothetical protein
VSPEIPPHIHAFVQRHLPSVAHLEVLLWMREHRLRWWNAGSLSASLGIPAPAAEKLLEELCSSSLLAVQVASAVSYQFSPATPALDALATEFVDLLRGSRAHVHGLLASPSARSARDFADAFKFRKK